MLVRILEGASEALEVGRERVMSVWDRINSFPQIDLVRIIILAALIFVVIKFSMMWLKIAALAACIFVIVTKFL